MLNKKEGACFGDGESVFLSKATKREFQLKREVHETCLTPNLPDVSLAWQFMKFSSSICLTYHLSEKSKALRKFSLKTHKLKVFLSSAQHSSCPYGPVNNMCLVLVDFRLYEKDPNAEFFLVCSLPYLDWIRKNTDLKNSLFGPFLHNSQLDFLEKILLQRIFFGYSWETHLFIYLFIFLTLFNVFNIYINTS